MCVLHRILLADAWCKTMSEQNSLGHRQEREESNKLFREILGKGRKKSKNSIKLWTGKNTSAIVYLDYIEPRCFNNYIF